MRCAGQSPLCPTVHHVPITQLCVGRTGQIPPPVQFVLGRRWFALYLHRNQEETWRYRLMGAVICTGEVGLKEARSFSMPSRSRNRTLELNSRDRTWREWNSFCLKCRGI